VRSALNLFDLLVVLAIIGFLLALLLPAVQKVRDSANRISSANNLKQIALACHNYHDTYNSFPSGNDGKNFSAAAKLLPFVEQDNLYKLIDFDKSMDDKANDAVRQTQVKTFLDPQDPVRTVKDGWGATNYLFNAGAKPALEDNDGVFFQDSKVRIPDITDGTSNTVLAGETLKGDGKTKAVTVERQYVALNDKGALKNLKDGTGVKEWKAGKHIVGDRCASWMDGRFLQGTFTGTRPPNDAKPDVSAEGGNGGLCALRTLGQGINAAFCDGSVHYVKKTINPKVWKLLSSRNDGEAINSDDF
jgi:prepilin-type processing-associated H-X9-DG protein